MSAELTEYFAEVEAELKELWMNDPPEIEEHDSVVTEDDLNPDRDDGAEISGGE